MEREQIEGLLRQIKGCTFASIDTETFPRPGIRKVSTNNRVILFASVKGVSGYESMVKRRLEEIGIDPERFNVGPLRWGSRVDHLPLIQHHGFYYLQTLELSNGEETFFLLDREIPKDMLEKFGIRHPIQGSPPLLPPNKRVVIQTYSLNHIKSIRLLGWEVQEKKKPKLRLKI